MLTFQPMCKMNPNFRFALRRDNYIQRKNFPNKSVATLVFPYLRSVCTPLACPNYHMIKHPTDIFVFSPTIAGDFMASKPKSNARTQKKSSTSCIRIFIGSSNEQCICIIRWFTYCPHTMCIWSSVFVCDMFGRFIYISYNNALGKIPNNIYIYVLCTLRGAAFLPYTIQMEKYTFFVWICLCVASQNASYPDENAFFSCVSYSFSVLLKSR